jgi:hypothetical protein
MPVTADEVATLRAYLAGDFDLHDRLYEQLDRTSIETGYMALVAAGFFEAVDRRFGRGPTKIADVIAFVGDLRSRSEDLGEAIDPHVAERLIRAALGDGSVADLDDKTVGGTQFLLLAGLVADERFTDAGLDSFMTEVRNLADQWTSTT